MVRDKNLPRCRRCGGVPDISVIPYQRNNPSYPKVCRCKDGGVWD